MNIIKLLDDKTINKIAAGEVIEKPASIVKEIVENSIDANSSEISVEIREGGISFIRVIDNGIGISNEDMEVAFLRHATSKISSDLDLYNIDTLGFRGEALASIASVSEVEMMSKKKDLSIGNKIVIQGGKKEAITECGCPDGTSITIKNVFFNTPARLKFLKSTSREGIYITEIMQNIAMSHPEISFKYKMNDKLVFATKGDGDLKAVILSIFGKQIVNNILEVHGNKEFISVKGYIGNSSIAKSSRNHQSFFVNGRYIKNKTITAAVEAAYKSMLTINKFPFCVLQLSMNPEFIDINVHPSKAEIKFQDEQLVFKTVYQCVKDSLVKFSSILNINNETASNSQNSYFDNLPKVNYVQQLIKEDIGKPIVENMYSVKEELKNESSPTQPNDKKTLETNFHKEAEINGNDNYKVMLINEITPKFGPLVIIGQFHLTYIIAEDPQEMYLIDQHAAHERIFYEKYNKNYKNSIIQSQSLLSPIVIDLTFSDKQVVFDNLHLFSRLGYEIEDFGGNSIALRGVPVIYGNPNPRDLFNEILLHMLTNNTSNKSSYSIIDKILYSMACKSAVKAGDKLSFKEMVELVEQLRMCENPFTCPHGRPTIIKMSNIELEKKFKRIQ